MVNDTTEPNPLLESVVEFSAPVDGGDIVRGLNNNDELVLRFIVEMLLTADSEELRERLKERLKDWSEEYPREEESAT